MNEEDIKYRVDKLNKMTEKFEKVSELQEENIGKIIVIMVAVILLGFWVGVFPL